MSVKITKEAFDAAPDADKPPVSSEPRQPEIPEITATELKAEAVADKMAEGFPAIDGSAFEPGKIPQKDTAGTEFDPKRHRMDAEGKPMVNADGKFSKRYTKRNEKADEDEYDATATMLTAGLFHFFGAVFDPDEAKPNPEFAEKIKDSYATALRAKGISITDPTWNAVGMTGIYAFGVVQQPKSREKAKVLWAGIKARFRKNPVLVKEAVNP
jgi:hypothetical protein